MFDEQPDGDPHGECAAEIHRLNDLVRWAYSKLHHVSFTRVEDALKLDEMKLLLEHGAPIPADVHTKAGEGMQVKRWPFVESPGEFTDRLAVAMRELPTLLAAVRYVLIETPPTLAAGVPRQAVQALRDELARDADASRFDLHGHGAVDDDYFAALRYVCGKLDAVLGVVPTPWPEPFWHVVVADEAPVINKAIRRADLAEEYAQNCRENGYRRVEVVPLYRHPDGVNGLGDGAERRVEAFVEQRRKELAAVTDEQLTAAFTRTHGGPNPLYSCNTCGASVLGVRNELVDHFNTHGVDAPATNQSKET
jgi:hypothetical protein